MRLRSTDVSMRTIGGETIVLDLASSKYLSVTGVGVRIVDLLQDECTPAGLADTISSEYDVEPGVAQRDVGVFLDKLRLAGLLQE